MNAKNGSDIPLAFFYFSALDEAGQQKVIDGCKGVKSRSEMKSYVDGISAIG